MATLPYSCIKNIDCVLRGGTVDKKGCLKSCLMLFVAGVLLIIAFGFVINYVFDMTPPKKSEMAKKYNKQKSELEIVAEYAEGYKFRYTNIDDAQAIKAKNNEQELFKGSMTKLFEKYGYDVIYTDGNDVYFQYWSNMDYGRGIVYSLDGKKPNSESEYFTVIEPIPEKNWYFYESSYKPNKVFGPY